MSDVRSIAAENLDLIGSYSPDLHERIYDAAIRNTADYSDRGVRRAMINIMVSCGFTTPMPAHGSSKPGKGKGLNKATTLYLKNVADALTLRNW